MQVDVAQSPLRQKPDKRTGCYAPRRQVFRQDRCSHVLHGEVVKSIGAVDLDLRSPRDAFGLALVGCQFYRVGPLLVSDPVPILHISGS